MAADLNEPSSHSSMKDQAESYPIGTEKDSQDMFLSTGSRPRKRTFSSRSVKDQ